MGNDLDMFVGDEDCSTNVVGMGVAVDKVCDWKVGHVPNCVEQFGANGRRNINDDDTLSRHEEKGLIPSICHHVGSFAKVLDIIASSIECGT